MARDASSLDPRVIADAKQKEMRLWVAANSYAVELFTAQDCDASSAIILPSHRRTLLIKHPTLLVLKQQELAGIAGHFHRHRDPSRARSLGREESD